MRLCRLDEYDLGRKGTAMLRILVMRCCKDEILRVIYYL